MIKVDVYKALGKRKTKSKKRGTTLTEAMYRAYRNSLLTGHSTINYSLTYD